MTKNYFTRLLQASLMCCLAVLFTACDEVFGSEDNPTPAYLSMNTSDVTLKVGESKTRTAIAVSTAIVEYSSDHPEFATVDANGTVTGVAAGTATITATATGYSSAIGKKIFETAKVSYKVIVEGCPAPAPALTMLQTPLTFEAAEAGAKVTFTIKVATGVEYSTDGENWSPYTSATPITLAAIGDKVSFRGTNAAYADNSNYSNISCDKECYIYGNIMSLIKKEDFENVTAFTADFTFEYLFLSNAKIKNHTDATKYLVLPATEITAHCYRYMFYGCTSLTTAPELPATTLAERCYYYMFSGCNALTTAPKLPATEMKDYCYSGMFNSCNTLTTAPELPATTLANYCYKSMFEGCTSLTAAPKLPTTTLTTGCYNSMFYDCTSLAEAWVKAGYNISCNYMFKGCATGGVLHTDGTGWAAGTNLPTGWTTTTYE